ncbi:MAG: ribbon-helix-helix domain-containing protein [Syntrophales bacterium]|nr:ribbon-helix-helix domain-containing protein [Syntrophales bacterium]
MNTQKVAITVPADLIAMIDTITKQHGISRSKFISMVLREKLLDERNRHLKSVYDRVFSDNAIRKEQIETATWFEGSGSKEGQEW